MNQIKLMTGKEIRFFFTDLLSLFFGFAMPILILVAVVTIFFGGPINTNVTGYVVDLADTAQTADFHARLAETEGLTVRTMTLAEAERRLERADITNYIVLETNFADKLAEGVVALKVYRRGDGGVEGQIFTSQAVAVATDIAAAAKQEQVVIADLAGLGLTIDPADAGAALAKYRAEQAAQPRLAVRAETLGQQAGQRSQNIAYVLPGIMSMFVVLSVTLAAESVVDERKRGTLERLMTTRLNKLQLIIGKWIAFTTRAIAQVAILLLVGWVWLRVFTPASFGQMMLFTVPVAMAAAALGMLIAALARSTDQAVWGSVIIANLFGVLGGAFMTIQPDTVLGQISRVAINHYINQGYRDIMARGLGVGSPAVLNNFLILLAFAAGLLALAMATFKVRGDDK